MDPCTFVHAAKAVPKKDAEKSNAIQPTHWTLAEVLCETLEHGSQILALNVDRAQKRGEATHAQLPQNPELTLWVDGANDSFESGGTAYEVEIKQPMRLSHLGLRQLYAASLKRVANIEKQAELARTLNEASLLYYKAWMLQRRHAMLSGLAESAKGLVNRLEKSLAQGEAPKLEIYLLKADAMQMLAQAEAAAAQSRLAEIELHRTMGSPWRPCKLASPELEPIPSDLFRIFSMSQKRANLRRLLVEKYRTAKRRHAVAQLDIFPAFAPQAAYREEKSGSSGWQVGVEMQLPIWDWNQSELQLSRALEQQAEAELRSVDRQSFEKLLETLHASALAAEKQARVYWDDVLPAYSKASFMARQELENGQISPADFWRTEQKIAEVYNKALQVQGESLIARTLLEQAMGGRIEEIP